MMRSLYTAATGMAAQQLRLDNIAHNLANANTSGFKKGRAEFADLLYQNMALAGAADDGRPNGIQVGLGVTPVGIQKLFTTGEMQASGNERDLAIDGDGFFQVERPDGTVGYTRDGAFKADANGRLVTAGGYPLVPEIVLPADTTKISVTEQGEVSVTTAGSSTATVVGTLELARFTNPGGLTALGRNLFEATEASGDPTLATPGDEGTGLILQGYLEGSNVDIMSEMVDMIGSQRSYELNSRAVRTSDEVLQALVQMV